MSTEYRNELGDTTTDPAVADGWSDAVLEVDDSVTLHRISRGWVVSTRDSLGSHDSEAFASETEARAYAAARAARVFGAG